MGGSGQGSGVENEWVWGESGLWGHTEWEDWAREREFLECVPEESVGELW